MDFFKNIGEKISETVDNGKRFVSEKSQDMKFNSELKNLAAEKEKVFTELGKAFFEQYGQQDIEEFAELLNKIRSIDENIKEVNEQIAAIKANKCKYCGAELEPGAHFCTKCGHKVEEEVEKEVETEVPVEEVVPEPEEVVVEERPEEQ